MAVPTHADLRFAEEFRRAVPLDLDFPDDAGRAVDLQQGHDLARLQILGLDRLDGQTGLVERPFSHAGEGVQESGPVLVAGE